MLEELVSMDEFKVALFQLHPDKAPRLNGFPTRFFQNCWGFLGKDLWLVVEEFRRTKRFVKDLNNSVLALIPNRRECRTFRDYRPISLCNTVYKVIAKVMANRLKKILCKIIAPNQNGFILGRKITGSILLISEVVHSLKVNHTSSMVIKVDVCKVYDKVSWDFLLKVMDHMGFSNQWCLLIKHCISSVRFFVLINGSMHGFFVATNGLCQGGPLSLSLFVIMVEALSCAIKWRRHHSEWIGITVAPNVEQVTHTQFADDTTLFGEESMREDRCIKATLAEYEQQLGKK